MESVSRRREGIKFNLHKITIILLGFLISRVDVLNSLTPFGIAFLGAYILTQNQSLGLLMSVMLGTLTFHGVAGWDYCLMAILIYMILTKLVSIERYSLIKSVVVISLIFFLFRLLIGMVTSKLTSYEILIIGFESILFFTISYVFAFATSIGKLKSTIKNNEELICTLITLALGLSGFSRLSIYGLSIKNIISMIVVIYLSYTEGALMGTGLGLTIGMVSYMSHPEMPFIIALLTAGGLLAGLFRELGKAGSALGFVLGNGIISFYINRFGISFFAYREILIAIPAFFLLSKYLKLDLKAYLAGNQQVKDEYKDKRDRLTITRLNNTGTLFNNLSQILEKSIEKERNYSTSQVYNLIDKISNESCKSCIKYQSCWKEDYYITYYNIFNLIGNVESKLKGKRLQTFKRKCINYNALKENTLKIYEDYKRDHSWNMKLLEQRQLLAEQVENLGQVVNQLAREIDKRPIFNEQLENLLIKELKNKKIHVVELLVVELADGMEIFVEVDTSQNPNSPYLSKLEELISNALGFPVVAATSYGNILDDIKSYRFIRANRYSTLTKVLSQSNSENLISGDSYTYGQYDNVSFMAISDGMGIGKKANEESQIAIDLLEKLMETRMDKSIIIKTINSILKGRTDNEIFTTLDLAFIDLYTGKLQSIKNGSPTTFIKRADGVSLINNRSLPLGILENVDLDVYEEELEDGDIVIMMSDGILESNRNVKDSESWMKDIIASIDSWNPQAIAKEIMEIAEFVSGNGIRDDMTIMATKIWRNL